MKNSIIRARCFFFTGCEEEPSVTVEKPTEPGCPLFATYQTNLRGHQVTQPVEPVDVGLQVTGFTLTEETLKGKGGGGSAELKNQPGDCKAALSDRPSPFQMGLWFILDLVGLHTRTAHAPARWRL